MAPALLLLCKLLALAILATGHYRILPDPFLPFLPFLDGFDPHGFRVGLQTIVILSALLLLFNRWVRVTAFLLGGGLLLAVISSRAYYGNNKTFVGLMLVLSALSARDGPPYLVRWQFALVYFGAALNKLLDPDWQSGLFFDYWGAVKIQNPLFLEVRGWLPPLAAGKVMCWGTILAEFFIAFALFVPRLVPWALWMNALFQLGLLQFTGGTFTLFFYAMQAAALAFLTWPDTLPVYASSGYQWLWPLRGLDPDHFQQWSPRENGTGFVVQEGRAFYTGYPALARLFLRSSVFWMAATVSLALLPAPAAAARRLLVGIVFLLLFPGFISSRAQGLLPAREGR